MRKSFVYDQESFIKDLNEKKLSVADLIKKYNFRDQEHYKNCRQLLVRKGLLQASRATFNHQKDSRIKAWETRKANQAKLKEAQSPVVNVKNSPVSDYRTIFFEDFSIKMHKKSMTNILIDKDHNVHVLK
jgi:hypothetical protein